MVRIGIHGFVTIAIEPAAGKLQPIGHIPLSCRCPENGARGLRYKNSAGRRAGIIRGAHGKQSEKKKEVLEAYEQATKIARQPKDVDYWLTRFFLDNRFLRLSPLTQADYIRYADVKAKPDKPDSRNGVRHVFGAMMPAKVQPHHIRRYLDYWAKAKKHTTANRHLSFLQTFFGWLREHNAGVRDNPAKGVKPFPETKRQYYITDGEYEKLMTAAIASNTPYVAAFMEISYLCGLRKFEALQLNMEDILPQGLLIKRGKGSKGEITEISARLQDALDFAIRLHNSKFEPIINRPLIRNTRGLRVTRSAIQQAFADIRSAAGLDHIWIHDLKKKAGTDGKDLGHMTARMRELYKVLPDIKKATR